MLVQALKDEAAYKVLESEVLRTRGAANEIVIRALKLYVKMCLI